MDWNHMKTFEEACEALGQAIGGARMREVSNRSAQASATVPEKFVQSLWNEGHIRCSGIHTVSGKALRIIQPGRWNQEAGPDFICAELEMEGRKIRGDIEIHVHASDWERHNHDDNFDYNRCILHVFLKHDDGKTVDRLFDGQILERLHLEPWLSADLETLKSAISVDDFPCGDGGGEGRCSRIFKGLGDEFIHRFLDLAGDRRIEEKVERLAGQMEGADTNQVLFQSLMISLGHKTGRTLFFLLSKRVPFRDLMDYTSSLESGEQATAMQALMLHVANLMTPDKESRYSPDEETLEYINRLNGHWMHYSGYFSDRVMPLTRRWFAGIRPVNFATRRIAGITRLITRIAPDGRLTEHIMSPFRMACDRKLTSKELRAFLLDINRLLMVTDDPYWSHRFNFKSKKSSRSMTLIGRDTASSLLFNAVLPMMILLARMEKNPNLEDFLWKCAHSLPPLPENMITTFMKKRLFGSAENASAYFFNERRQQALFTVFHDCCNSNEHSCETCLFYSTANRNDDV